MELASMLQSRGESTSVKQGICMKKVSLIKVTALVAAALLGSAIVSAEDVNSDTEKSIETLTKPETVNLVETKVIPVVFDALDKSKDGQISKREVKASNNEKLKLIFDSLDSNKDAMLSKDEFKEAIKRI